MTAPTLQDLHARIQAVKAAPMLLMKPAAEVALMDFLQYLAAQDARIETLERMVKHGNQENPDS